MPWRKRHHLPDDVFADQRHIVSITICTADKRQWLKVDSLAKVVRDEILRIHLDHPVLGFCLMPDHVHLLLCNSTVPVGKIMNLLKGRTSHRIRKTHPTLQVWQRGYWDHIVRRQEGLYTVLQYIFQNPVRAGLVESWWEYQWLGSPMLGPVGPDFFGTASPEDIMWLEILRV
jgi:putative transposase